jgi:uncharacterized protein YdaT
MKYREIVSVTGMSGLYQLLTTKSDGAIVRNVADKSTKFISARQHNVTPLESIEVYTTGENVRLQEVFKKMQEHETDIPMIEAKNADNNGIKNYFKSIFPEFDEERVYVSDMKKMLKWYELLKTTDLLHFEEENTETEESATEEADGAEEVNAVAEKAEEAENATAGEPEAVSEPKAVAAEEDVAESPAKAKAKKAKE